MKKSTFKFLALIGLAFVISFSSCEDDKTSPATTSNNCEIQVTTPATYSFNRLGNSTVSYSGQTSRLDQLGEMTVELKKADAGTNISSSTLLNMYANTNNPFSQVYTKNLKSKTFALDTTYFKNLLIDAAAASGTTTTASDGVIGLLQRSNGSSILVDAGGREYTQLFEKGLMGATFYNQIVNNYLTVDKIGSSVDNSAIDSANGKYYTAMEHHFDEAFGYMGFPIDFSSNYSGSGTVRFWGKYSNTANNVIPTMNNDLMNAFKTGRAAIVAKEYGVLDQQVEILYQKLEVMIAATAIHYINSTVGETNTGNRHHSLSEAYTFVRALRYSNFNYRIISSNDIMDMLDNRIGSNFYNTTSVNLKYVKDTLSSAFGLDAVKDQL